MLHIQVVGHACQTSMVPLGPAISTVSKDGDEYIGLIKSKTACLVLRALLEEEPEQTSICVAESD